MKHKNVLFSLLLVVVVFLFAILRYGQEPQRKELLDRHPRRVGYAAYALCRMRCLNVDKQTVESVLQEGVILFHKSNRRAYPCPLFTVQARSPDGRTVRLVLEQCRSQTTVLNCFLPARKEECTCTAEPFEKER